MAHFCGSCKEEKQAGSISELRMGLGQSIHYPTAIYRQKAYENLGLLEGSYPLAEEIAATELSIPMYYGMTEEQIRYVIDTLNRWR